MVRDKLVDDLNLVTTATQVAVGIKGIYF